MRKLMLLTIIVGLFFGSAFIVSAQDDMMDKVVCDANLILDLYIAEYYFGFGQVMDSMMMGETDNDMMGLDLSIYEKGQYAALFDDMMMSGMMGMMIDEETLNAVKDDMAMGMMDDDMMAALAPLAVEGEPAECTALRSELHLFYTALVYHNMMMMSEG